MNAQESCLYNATDYAPTKAENRRTACTVQPEISLIHDAIHRTVVFWVALLALVSLPHTLLAQGKDPQQIALLSPRELYLILIVVSVPAAAVIGWLTAELSLSWHWKPRHTYSRLGASWIIYYSWNHVAEQLSGYRPSGRLLLFTFAILLAAPAVTIATGTKRAFGEVQWTVPEIDSGLISLGLNKPPDNQQ